MKTDITDMVEYLNSQDSYDEIVDEWEGRGAEFSTNAHLKRLRLLEGGRERFRYHCGTIKNDVSFYSLGPGICIDLDMAPHYMIGLDIEGELITLKGLLGDGIRDVTNIKPHEYGVLKLKYGVMKESMFIPKVFHPLIQVVYKELGL